MLLLTARARAFGPADVAATRLRDALTDRVLIEQAKGVLAEREGVSVHEALETLRSRARTGRTTVLEVAREVTGRTADEGVPGRA